MSAALEAGEEIVSIARGNQPAAKLIAVHPLPKRQFGLYQGLAKIGPEFFEPLPEDELRAWDGEAYERGYSLTRIALSHGLRPVMPPCHRSRHEAITTTPDVFISAASAWEVRTKYRLGKLPSAAALANDLATAVQRLGFMELPVAFADGAPCRRFDFGTSTADPFDRMLIAQALNHELALVSNEEGFDAFGITRVW